jgi:hypothetical protein
MRSIGAAALAEAAGDGELWEKKTMNAPLSSC